MHRLGYSNSRPAEWEKSPAFYNRLTLSVTSGVNRPIGHYPRPLVSSVSTENISPIRVMRTDLMDVGHVRTYYDLCKFF